MAGTYLRVKIRDHQAKVIKLIADDLDCSMSKVASDLVTTGLMRECVDEVKEKMDEAFFKFLNKEEWDD